MKRRATLLAIVLFGLAPAAAGCVQHTPARRPALAPLSAPLERTPTRVSIGPGVDRVDEYVFYSLVGDSLRSVDGERRAIGPENGLGGRSYGYTYTHIDYRYADLSSSEGCRPTNVRITLTVTTTMPDWRAEARAAPREQREWDRFIGALTVHEGRHADIGVRRSLGLKDALESTTAPDCPALVEATRVLFDSVIGSLREEHRDYDVATHGGATEGAYLNY
ncbi:MAG: DUF922 domain-containing protein [Polyangiaceae bacterium]